MQTSWRHFLPVFGLLCATTFGPTVARANGHHGATAVVAPTAYVETTPTAYVLPTAYVAPTSYVLPTVYSYAPSSYVATSYLLESSYAYVAPTQWTAPVTRRYVERPVYAATSYVLAPAAYYPTAYYPTVLAQGSASYAGDPCGTPCPTPCATEATGATRYQSGAATAAPTPQHGTASGTSNTAAAARRAPPSTVESEPARPAVGPAAEQEPMTTRETPPAPATSAVDSNNPSPPIAPAPDTEAAPPVTPSAGKAADKTTTPPAAPKPIAPGAGAAPLDLPIGEEAAETVRRDNRKPVVPTPAPKSLVRTTRQGSPNVLQGRVVSSDGGAAEEGVRLTISNRLGTFADRVVTTDAFGRYAVRVPDGDWTVKVMMPSGRNYVVSQLTVNGGQIVDDLGRDIPTLTITR